MTSRLLFYITLSLFLSNCGTPYKHKDCQIPEERLGQCFADSGISSDIFLQYKNYCTNDHSISPSTQKFDRSYIKKMTEHCQDVKSIFMRGFRASLGKQEFNKCSTNYSHIADIGRINADATLVAEYYIESNSREVDFYKAQKRRSRSDKSSEGGLWDRVIEKSPSSIKKELEATNKKLASILDKYRKHGVYEAGLNSATKFYSVVILGRANKAPHCINSSPPLTIQ